MGDVEPVRPEPEEQEFVTPPEQGRAGLLPLGSVWEAGGVVWEVLPLGEVDQDEDGYDLLPAAGN